MNDIAKKQKELFVYNAHGCHVLDIVLVLLLLPCLLLLHKAMVLKSKTPVLAASSNNLFSSLVMEYVTLVIPLLLAITCLSQQYIVLIYTAVGCSILFLLCMQRIKFEWSLPSDQTIEKYLLCEKPRLAALSAFKGANLLLTCLSILAVDFSIYPRQFAKTDQFGQSLMDIGVGTFIIASALTSKHARSAMSINVENPYVADSNNLTEQGGGWLSSKLHRAAKHWLSLPGQRLATLGLGIGRLVLLKAFNYQEHSSEYGLHWNFFVTLFCVWTIADGVHAIVRSSTAVLVLSIAVLLAYQYCLLEYEWTDLVIHAPRDKNFFYANREGIFSLFGFVPLYLWTESLSKIILYRRTTTLTGDSTTSNSTQAGAISVPVVASQSTIFTARLFHIFYLASFHWIVWIICDRYVQKTSRRLTNAAFVCFCMALSWTFLLAISLVEACKFSLPLPPNISSAPQSTSTTQRLDGSGGTKPGRQVEPSAVSPVAGTQSIILDRLNSHQLKVFLLANVLTGLVNLTTDTIGASFSSSLALLHGYAFLVVSTAWMLERLKAP